MTILRFTPMLLESYSTVSTLPRSILSRGASKPLGALAGSESAALRGHASRRNRHAPCHIAALIAYSFPRVVRCRSMDELAGEPCCVSASRTAGAHATGLAYRDLRVGHCGSANNLGSTLSRTLNSVI